jgi:hypothetical protein
MGNLRQIQTSLVKSQLRIFRILIYRRSIKTKGFRILIRTTADFVAWKQCSLKRTKNQKHSSSKWPKKLAQNRSRTYLMRIDHSRSLRVRIVTRRTSKIQLSRTKYWFRPHLVTSSHHRQPSWEALSQSRALVVNKFKSRLSRFPKSIGSQSEAEAKA